jgi:GNAT superfamily N-acetyltransferase
MVLAVAPNWQRRGVARMLMQSAESALIKRVREYWSSPPAISDPMHTRFYESCGYSFTGRRYKKSFAVYA